jgi:hypothetical protein
MDIPASERERQRLQALYAGMSDSELQQLAESPGFLTELALEALAQEAQHRGLNLPLSNSATPQDVLEQRQLTVVRQFRDMPEALLAKGLLESAGIECFLVDDNLVRLNWFISNGIGGIKLAVNAEDAQSAAEILAQPIPEAFDVGVSETYQQPRCPRCSSIDISYEAGTDKRFALPALYVGGVPLPVPRNVWKCASCGARWREVPDEPGSAVGDE